MNMNFLWSSYLPYFAFAMMAIGGAKYKYPAVVIAGILFTLFYEPTDIAKLILEK